MQRISVFHKLKELCNRKYTIIPLLTSKNIKLYKSQLKSNFSSSPNNWGLNPNTNVRRCFVDQHNIFRSPFHDLEIPSAYLHEIVWKNVDKWWNNTAVVCAVSGRSYTYRELKKLTERFATSLRYNKLMAGDTLAVVLPNIPEYAIVVLGASVAGVKLTLLNPTYTSYEMGIQIAHSESSAVITIPDLYPTILESIKGMNSIHLPTIIVPISSESLPSGTINFKDLVADGIEDFETIRKEPGVDVKNDTLILPYSSGTTGMPKGVELTHRNIVSNLTQGRHPEYTFAEPGINGFKEIVPAFLPFFHIYGLVACLFIYLSWGGKVICIPKFTPNILLDVLQKNRVTSLYVAPPIVQLMVNDERFCKEHLQHLKNVMSGAAPLGSELITKFFAKMGTTFQFTQGYGLTETSPLVSRGKYSDWASAGLIAVNTQVRIVGTDDKILGRNLGINETGEIVVKGPQVMKGYYKNKEATDDCMDGEWFKTGDLGHIDDKGQLFITGRLKELIKAKGFQVAPAELEDLIHGHEKIADVAIIGVPHARLGEAPKAFIVPKSNVKVTVEEIKNYVAERLSKHKHLYEVQFIDKIPKSASGKILRRELEKL